MNLIEMDHVANKVSNYIGQGVLLLVLFLFSNTSFAKNIKVAIIDTGFCISKSEILKQKKFVHVNDTIDLTNQNFTCQENSNMNSRRYHGQKVLNQFLETLANDIKIQLSPFIIFDKNGKQSPRAWQKVMSTKFQRKFDLIIIAAGLKLKNKKNIKREIITNFFLAAGRIGKSIKKGSLLFPQLLAPNNKIFLIGNYAQIRAGQEKYMDIGLLYKNQISYFMADSFDRNSLTGSSRAVSTAAAKSLNICHKELGNKLRSCLKRNSKKIKFVNFKKDGLTF